MGRNRSSCSRILSGDVVDLAARAFSPGVLWIQLLAHSLLDVRVIRKGYRTRVDNDPKIDTKGRPILALHEKWERRSI